MENAAYNAAWIVLISLIFFSLSSWVYFKNKKSHGTKPSEGGRHVEVNFLARNSSPHSAGRAKFGKQFKKSVACLYIGW